MSSSHPLRTVILICILGTISLAVLVNAQDSQQKYEIYLQDGRRLEVEDVRVTSGVVLFKIGQITRSLEPALVLRIIHDGKTIYENGTLLNEKDFAPSSSNPRVNPKLLGDNPFHLYTALSNYQKAFVKSQFETTAEYKVRIARVLNGISAGGKKASDRFTFILTGVESSYDADKGYVYIKQETHGESIWAEDLPHFFRGAAEGGVQPNTSGLVLENLSSAGLFDSEKTLGTAVGQNAFGVKKRYVIKSFTSFRLVMPDSKILLGRAFRIKATKDEARQIVNNTLIALTGKLLYPYVAYASTYSTATLTNPQESHTRNHYLFFNPESFTIYNVQTGEVYGSKDLH